MRHSSERRQICAKTSASVDHFHRSVRLDKLVVPNAKMRWERSEMKGTYLRFYVHELRKREGKYLYDWLLEKAKAMGIHGGSAFRAIAGYGRHGVLHEQRFFELVADLTVEVEFVVTDEEAERLLEMVRQENIHLVYAKVPAEFGVIEGRD